MVVVSQMTGIVVPYTASSTSITVRRLSMTKITTLMILNTTVLQKTARYGYLGVAYIFKKRGRCEKKYSKILS